MNLEDTIQSATFDNNKRLVRRKAILLFDFRFYDMTSEKQSREHRLRKWKIINRFFAIVSCCIG